MKGAKVESHEQNDQDIQWTRIVELELVPHPDQLLPEITEMDFGMNSGALRMKQLAATAGHILRKWCMDCSPIHSFQGGGMPVEAKESVGFVWGKKCRDYLGLTNVLISNPSKLNRPKAERMNCV